MKARLKSYETEVVVFTPGMQHPWINRKSLFPEPPTIAENEKSIRETGLPAITGPMREYECVVTNGFIHRLKEGDYIVKDRRGGLLVLNKEQFEANYDIVQD